MMEVNFIFLDIAKDVFAGCIEAVEMAVRTCQVTF